jgi:hypothetical protein
VFPKEYEARGATAGYDKIRWSGRLPGNWSTPQGIQEKERVAPKPMDGDSHLELRYFVFCRKV